VLLTAPRFFFYRAIVDGTGNIEGQVWRRMLERITFLLAVIGYAGLTTTALLAALRKLPVVFWRGVALVIVSHVVLVWMVRYDWQLASATRNGYVGFLVFHGALVLIVASLFLAERSARVFVWTAFAIVSLGALGAVFRYEVVAIYRAPVVLVAAVGAGGLVRAYHLSRRRRTTAA
jgi:hypothetical protein